VIKPSAIAVEFVGREAALAQRRTRNDELYDDVQSRFDFFAAARGIPYNGLNDDKGPNHRRSHLYKVSSKAKCAVDRQRRSFAERVFAQGGAGRGDRNGAYRSDKWLISFCDEFTG
jgi:hypothetical protein